MSIIKPFILALALLLTINCGGPENKNENAVPSPSPATVSTPKADKPCESLETPCDGKLLVRHAYSLCCSGVWHVVEDAYHNCPPLTVFRVSDSTTMQTCEAGSPVPEGLGPYPEIRDLCPNSADTGEKITITECFRGQWRTATYSIYKCPETNAKGILKATPDSVKEHRIPCSEGMPRFAPAP